MKNLVYLTFFISIFFSSCKKDNLVKPGRIITISEDIKSNETWVSENTYIIEGNVDVNSNAVLTIEAGTTIKFEADAELSIAYYNGFGAIKAIGTEDKPILFTSNASSKNAGDWEIIWLDSGSSGSEFNYCNFEYGGGYSELYGMVYLKDTKASFTNCSFTNSASYGLSLDTDAGLTAFENNTFNNCYRNPLLIYGNYLHNLGTGNNFATATSILVMEDDLDNSGTFTWKNQGVPYNFNGYFRIGSASGTTIVIEPGTHINMSSNSEIIVADHSSKFGIIQAIGTAEKPILIGSASPFPAAGDWRGIWLYEGTGAGTTFEYCTISYGGGYSFGGNILFMKDVGANVNISNTTISNSDKYGIYRSNVNYDLPTLTNVNFVSNTSGDYNI